MKKYQIENQKEFDRLKKKAKNGNDNTPSPYRKRGTSSKQQRSSGGTGGPTWQGLSSNIASNNKGAGALLSKIQ